MNFLIRTDGSISIGNGHIFRMIALADELISRNFPVTFLIKKDDFWIDRLKKKYTVIKCDENNKLLYKILDNFSFTHFIYDTRNDLNKSDFLKIRKTKSNPKIIVNDSPEKIRKYCDIFLSPPIIQVKEWDWSGFQGKIFSDWDFVILRKEFLKTISKNKNSKNVVLSFGSTDPFLITEKVLHLLNNSGDKFKSLTYTLIVGPQFDRIEKIKLSSSYKNLNIEILKSPSNIVEIFNSAFFAIISFGVTAYELAALKVPFLSVSISNDHEKSAEIFSKNNISSSLGLVDNLENNFCKLAKNFLKNLNKKNINFNFQICNWNKIISSVLD